MIQEEILNGNRLIAEFMDIHFHENDTISHYPNILQLNMGIDKISDLTFNSSWNLLMPVYKKIKDYLSNIERPSQNHCCKGDSMEVDIHCALMSIDIDKTFFYIVEFIKWYNTQTI